MPSGYLTLRVVSLPCAGRKHSSMLAVGQGGFIWIGSSEGEDVSVCVV
jgi:hypothetical protein